jgi:hypothetical protein
MYGFGNGDPGSSVGVQLVRWGAYEALAVAFLVVVVRHRDELVRSW